MSGHIHSGASSYECELVRALEYATPRLLDYSPQEYIANVPPGHMATNQRDHDLCGAILRNNRHPSRLARGFGQSRGGGQTLSRLLHNPRLAPHRLAERYWRRRVAAAAQGQSAPAPTGQLRGASICCGLAGHRRRAVPPIGGPTMRQS